MSIATVYDAAKAATLFHGDCLSLFEGMPEDSLQLVVTSPPYNLGKKYERRISIEEYLEKQAAVIRACAKRLKRSGSICWQVGNHVNENEIVPLDVLLHPIFTEAGLVLRNRIVWHFEHGLHCSRRLSGRYETIMWYTWPGKDYVFNLDAVRIPQKYPGKKYFKGPKRGQYSANPLGKNPGDVWIIPNVKHNHVEKTIHPCQFPVELVERLILALSRQGDLVLDPYMGVGTTLVASLLHGRRSAGAEIVGEYVEIARRRLDMASRGTLRTRPRNRDVYKPQGKLTATPW